MNNIYDLAIPGLVLDVFRQFLTPLKNTHSVDGGVEDPALRAHSQTGHRLGWNGVYTLPGGASSGTPKEAHLREGLPGRGVVPPSEGASGRGVRVVSLSSSGLPIVRRALSLSNIRLPGRMVQEFSPRAAFAEHET